MITRFYVHNYRCLENFELSLANRRSTLLLGRNGSGKSTIGRALEVLQFIARGASRVGQLVNPADFARARADAPMRFELEAIVRNVAFSYSLALELPEGFRELRVQEETLIAGGRVLYRRDLAQVEIAKDEPDATAKFVVDWHLVALPVIQERSKDDPLPTFRTWLAQLLFLTPLPSRMTGDSDSESLLPNAEATNLGEWLTGLLASSPAAYAHIDGYMKKTMPDFWAIKNPLVGKNSRSITIEFRNSDTTLELPFGALSDGEKCFFICAILLAANDSYGPLVAFWDEPDNYLSISEVGHFVMALRRAFEKGGQLIVTSHNPEAIRQFTEDSTLVLDRRSHLEPARIRPLSELTVPGDLIETLILDDLQV